MEKDERYKAVKRLIEKGDITEFNEMFTYIPKTVVARDLGAAPARFSEKMNLIEKFTLQRLKICRFARTPHHADPVSCIKQFLRVMPGGKIV